MSAMKSRRVRKNIDAQSTYEIPQHMKGDELAAIADLLGRKTNARGKNMPTPKTLQRVNVVTNKKSLDPQMFIFMAATDKKFRDKYFKNPKALETDYEIAKQDLVVIKKIDFAQLRKDLKSIEAGILDAGQLKADTCHDSHSSHGSGTHSSGYHTNNCSGMLNVLLSEELVKAVKTR